MKLNFEEMIISSEDDFVYDITKFSLDYAKEHSLFIKPHITPILVDLDLRDSIHKLKDSNAKKVLIPNKTFRYMRRKDSKKPEVLNEYLKEELETINLEQEATIKTIDKLNELLDVDEGLLENYKNDYYSKNQESDIQNLIKQESCFDFEIVRYEFENEIVDKEYFLDKIKDLKYSDHALTKRIFLLEETDCSQNELYVLKMFEHSIEHGTIDKKEAEMLLKKYVNINKGYYKYSYRIAYF